MFFTLFCTNLSTLSQGSEDSIWAWKHGEKSEFHHSEINDEIFYYTEINDEALHFDWTKTFTQPDLNPGEKYGFFHFLGPDYYPFIHKSIGDPNKVSAKIFADAAAMFLRKSKYYDVADILKQIKDNFIANSSPKARDALLIGVYSTISYLNGMPQEYKGPAKANFEAVAGDVGKCFFLAYAKLKKIPSDELYGMTIRIRVDVEYSKDTHNYERYFKKWESL